MKKIYLLLLTVLCAAVSTNAQLTGTLNIPGAYPNLGAAITDLNTQGVGAGGVTFNLLAGNPQTAPAGGYSITATGIVANQITFNGNANIITASAALTAGNLNDAIFKLIGSDYVTISGFNMQENAANTVTAAATNNMTEWGVALLYTSLTDGAQNNTISSNTISLNRTYTNTFGIYSNVRHSATDVITVADITAATGANSNNKVYSNIISNVNMGITFIGSAVAATMDNTNDIGGIAAGTGNTITNWGGAAAASAFASNVATSYCILAERQVGINVSFNTVTSAALNFAGTLLGIYVEYTTTAPTGTFTNNVNNNTMTLTNSFVGAATQMHIIRHSSAGGANATATANMNNNTILNCAITGVASAITPFSVLNTAAFGTMNINGNIISGFTSTATAGGFVGITNQGAVTGTVNLNNNQVGTAAVGGLTYSVATTGAPVMVFNSTGAATTTVNINNNIVRGLSFVSSGQLVGVTNQGAPVGVAINMNNNQMGTAGSNFCTYSAASTGAIVPIFNSNGAATALLTITGNDIRGIAQNVTSSGAHLYIQNQTFTGSVNISSNTFTNITANTTGSVTFIGNSISRAASKVSTVNNNSVVTAFNKPAAGGTILFYTSFGVSPATCTEINTGNNFSNMTFTGATTITGWRSSDGTGNTGAPKTVTNNIFNNIVTGTSAATILECSFGTTATVTNNTITNITGPGAIIGFLSSSGNLDLSQTVVSGISSTAGGVVNGLSIGGTTAATTKNIFKNKIGDLQSATATGTVNGILISSGIITNVTNNLIGDLRAPAATGTDAIRGISMTSTTATSGINLYNNTVYLNASSSGANFGTSGIFHTTSTTATTSSLTMRNNIIYNNSFANGTGVVAAFRRSSGAANTLLNYNAASNNNLLFAGTPSANRLIYSDGTSSAQTLAAYQAGVFTAGTIAPRDAASRTELSTPFLSTAVANANFLHISTAIQTVVESGGANIAGVIDDYDGDVRNAVTPDMGADEFAGLAVTACVGTPVAGTITGTNNICQGQFAILTLSGYSTNSGISIQWQSSAVSGGPYAPIAGETGATYNTGVIPTGTTVYYVATVTCANGGGNATTVQFAVTSNAAPTVAVNPPAPTICSGSTGVALTASGALTYVWSPATGLSGTTGATVTANPTVTTTYTVTGTNAAGCTSTANVTVTVNPSPTITSPASATPATICSGANSQLNVGASSNLGYTINAVPFAPIATGAGTVTLCAGGVAVVPMTATTLDDGYWNALALPFSFTYFGTSYNTFNVQTNGIISFSPYTTTTGYGSSPQMPNVAVPNNILGVFGDMDWGFGGTISYYTSGVAPNRIFVVNFNGGGFYNSGLPPTALVNYQIQLFENGNKVQIHTTSITSDASHLHTMGIENAGGTAANVVTGRNNTLWSLTNDGTEFAQSPLTYLWSPATFLSSTTIPNPVATAVTATTTYTVTVSEVNGCSSSSNVTVTVLSPVVTAVLVQPTTCVTTNGSITLTVTGGTGGVGPYSYAWVGPGVNPTSQNQVNLGVGSYTVTVTDIPSGCTSVLTYALPGPGGCNICPTVPTLTTNPTPAVCQNANVTLTASGLTNMGVTYGITFKYSLVALADPYVGGTVIATVPNGGLTAGGTVASTTTTFAAAGNYFIYAILSPLPVDITCRPFATTNLTVNSLPTVNAVANQTLCRGATTAAINFTGAPVGTTFTWTNNTPAIGLAASGSGNIAPFVAQNNTGVAIVATITVTPTFTGGGTTCSGTPTTFTITVNSNLPLLIVAVPGTTLCQGDPAALTVYESTGPAPVSVNHSSANTITANNSVSCGTAITTAVNSFWRVYDLSTFPAISGNFTINTVTFGVELSSGGPQNVTVNLYTQTGGAFPGGTRTLLVSQVFSVPNLASALYTATLAVPPTVSNTSVIVVEAMTAGAVNTRFFLGSNAAAETGPTYLSAAACGIAAPTTTAAIGFPNMHGILFLSGSIPGAGGIATGTFLWSPAAGLSSTTTNPVAASPAVTTTYTVVRTTVAGCVGTANITLTVNQRPTITSHPANATVCATSIATFTVTGTGTGITYQWQEAVGAGPFVNLANGTPYGGVNTPTLTINPVTAIMNGNRYRCVLGGTCPPAGTANISNPALLTVNGLPVVTITPAGPVCGGIAGINGTLLSTGSAAPPIPGSLTVNSGTIAVAIPDGPATWPQTSFPGVATNMTVAGIPANATITGMSVKLNLTHTYIADMVIVLKAPNGAVLNLDANINKTGGAGANFINTFINSTSTTPLSAGLPPYSAAFQPDAVGATYVAVGFTFPGGPTSPAGYIPTVSTFPGLYTTPNGTWSLGMYDWGAGDLGTLTNWELKIDYTTPGGTGTPLTFTWSPATGLFTNPTATLPYIAGSQTPQVYAAPTANTVYTVTGTDGTTGCSNTANVLVIFTPPAPTVTPSSVTMCLGDPAVKLKAASSQAFTTSFASGTINTTIPDGPTIPPVPTSYPAIVSNITVSGIPAVATISNVRVRFNVTHVYVSDLVIALKAPNGQIINLSALANYANPAGSNFVNTTFSSASTTAITPPYTGTYRADLAGATFNALGFTWPGGPTGYVPTSNAWSSLYSTPNGVWSVGLYDAGFPDGGVWNDWTLEIDYIIGVVTTPAIWSPIAGLFSDASASTAYVAGTAVDSVWTKPSASGVYPYTATVASIGPDALQTFTNPAPITITNGGSTPYPSNITVTGLPTTGVSVRSVTLTNLSHTWSDDIDILLQSPTGQNVILMSDVGGASIISNATYIFNDAGLAMGTGANAGGTYHPTNLVGTLGVEPDAWVAPGPGTVAQVTPALSLFGNTANVNGAWKLFVVDDFAGDDGTIAGGYSITFSSPTPGCTSPGRTVIVTVNTPITIIGQPINDTVCTNEVATFTVAGAGTSPTYQWQVSTDNGNTFNDITNGGVYSGATTATLVITAPPVSMNNYQYRARVNGAAPCASGTSFRATLIVNALPTIVISASPYTRLLPGLFTTLSSVVTPVAAATNGGYVWLRNGVQVPGSTGTLTVGIDALGDYSLRVTNINGCTNTSNVITISDSVSGKCFIYPNPNSGKFQVRFFSAANNVLPRGIVVYDGKGDKVLTQSYIVGRPYDRMDVDLRKNGKGLYWVEIVDTNGNRIAMCRVVIQ